MEKENDFMFFICSVVIVLYCVRFTVAALDILGVFINDDNPSAM